MKTMETYKEAVKRVAKMYDYELFNRKGNHTNEEVCQAVFETFSICYGVRYEQAERDIYGYACLP